MTITIKLTYLKKLLNVKLKCAPLHRPTKDRDEQLRAMLRMLKLFAELSPVGDIKNIVRRFGNDILNVSERIHIMKKHVLYGTLIYHVVMSEIRKVITRQLIFISLWVYVLSLFLFSGLLDMLFDLFYYLFY